MNELLKIFGTEKPKEFVEVETDSNTISFTIQEGPRKEVGVNGCQVDDMVQAARIIIESFNEAFPCRENAIVITKLDEALLWLGARHVERMKRGVEGYNKE